METLLFGSLLLVEPRDLALAGFASAGALAATLTLGPGVARDGIRPHRRRGAGGARRLYDGVLLALMALVVVAALSALGALLALRWSPCRPRRCACGPTAWPVAGDHRRSRGGGGDRGTRAVGGAERPPGATIATLSGGCSQSRPRVMPRRLAAGSRPPWRSAPVLVLALGAWDDDSGVRVVATTTQVADWARQIKGDGFTAST